MHVHTTQNICEYNNNIMKHRNDRVLIIRIGVYHQEA